MSLWCPINCSLTAAWLVRFVFCAARICGRLEGPLLVHAPYITAPLHALPVLLLRNLPHGPLPPTVSCSRLGCLTFRFVALPLMHHAPSCTDGCSMQKNFICNHSFAHFQAVGQSTDSLLQYLHWQPRPQLHPIVYLHNLAHVSVPSSFLGSGPMRAS